MECFDQLIEDVFKSEEDYCLDEVGGSDEAMSWLDAFIDTPLLNDCMLSASLDGPWTDEFNTRIQSEHSYSVSSGNCTPDDATKPLKINTEQELEAQMIMVDPNMTMSSDDDDTDSHSPSGTDDEVSETHDSGIMYVGNDSTCLESETEIIVNSDDGFASDDHHGNEQIAIGCESNAQCEGTTAPKKVVLFNGKTVTTNSRSNASPTTYVLTYQPTTSFVTRPAPTIIVTKTRHFPYTTGGSGLTRTQGVGGRVKCGGAGAIIDGTRRTMVPTTLLKKTVVRPQALPLDNDQQLQEFLYYDDDSNLPPSPPSSEGEGLSPRRDPPPSPPESTRVYTQHVDGVSLIRPSHVSASGQLVLTDEERRTLISEGYSVPTRLPLTKQEENNLKKIQRKIKNKMSAQESRRKKKDYLDMLEKKLEVSHQENNQLKKQLELLQSDNSSLVTQVQKLQSLASKLRPSVETSTCVMVFALFFTMFMGTFWSPATLSVSLVANPLSNTGGAAVSMPAVPAAIESNLQNIIDDYRTPNMKSRTLMMIDDSAYSGAEDPVQSANCRDTYWLPCIASADTKEPPPEYPDQSPSRVLGSIPIVDHERINGSSDYRQQDVKEISIIDEVVSSFTPDIPIIVITRSQTANVSAEPRSASV